ncbi:MAG: hypothetical protein MUF47_01410, partial [Porphyrobacter sp.]|nr:hypothetical protein [Porphyrobacter sp.]
AVLTVADVEAKLAAGTQTLTFPLMSGGRRVASLSLDGSVEKIRFMNISKVACNLEGRWIVNLP